MTFTFHNNNKYFFLRFLFSLTEDLSLNFHFPKVSISTLPRWLERISQPGKLITFPRSFSFWMNTPNVSW